MLCNRKQGSLSRRSILRLALYHTCHVRSWYSVRSRQTTSYRSLKNIFISHAMIISTTDQTPNLARPLSVSISHMSSVIWPHYLERVYCRLCTDGTIHDALLPVLILFQVPEPPASQTTTTKLMKKGKHPLSFSISTPASLHGAGAGTDQGLPHIDHSTSTHTHRAVVPWSVTAPVTRDQRNRLNRGMIEFEMPSHIDVLPRTSLLTFVGTMT